MERWEKINDLGYWVSNKGRVFSEARPVRLEINGNEYFRNKKSRFLNPNISPAGYPRVRICGETIHVHKLVAEKFLGCSDWGRLTVNHKDLNKQNNDVTNLEVVTNSENVIHGWENGAYESQYRKIRCVETGELYETEADAARSMRRAPGNLCSHLKGRQKTFAGLHFEYA